MVVAYLRLVFGFLIGVFMGLYFSYSKKSVRCVLFTVSEVLHGCGNFPAGRRPKLWTQILPSHQPRSFSKVSTND